MAKTLALYLQEMQNEHGVDPKLTGLIAHIAETCKDISFKVSLGALAGVLATDGRENVHGETQRTSDITADHNMSQH